MTFHALKVDAASSRVSAALAEKQETRLEAVSTLVAVDQASTGMLTPEWRGLADLWPRDFFLLRFFDILDSTNLRARREAAEGAAEGTVYLAGRQTAGRGREGRRWCSDDRGGIYCSVLFRPGWPIAESLLFVKLAALAVFDTLTETIGWATGSRPADPLPLRIKPPNDLLLNGRKVCGILVESASLVEVTQYVIVGMGLNVNQTDFPKELSASATSLRREYGLVFDPIKILVSLLQNLRTKYQEANKHGSAALEKSWASMTGEEE